MFFERYVNSNTVSATFYNIRWKMQFFLSKYHYLESHYNFFNYCQWVSSSVINMSYIQSIWLSTKIHVYTFLLA